MDRPRALIRPTLPRDALHDPASVGEPLALRPSDRRPAQESADDQRNLHTTTAATIFEGGIKDNVLPAHARAVINFRIKPGETVNDVLSHAAKVVNDRRVLIGVLEPKLAKAASPQSSASSRAFLTIERTIREVMPTAVVAPALVVAATDTGHYQDLAEDIYRFIPVVFGPDDPARLHGTNERIAVEVYRDCVRFYAQLLINESQTSGASLP